MEGYFWKVGSCTGSEKKKEEKAAERKKGRTEQRGGRRRVRFAVGRLAERKRRSENGES